MLLTPETLLHLEKHDIPVELFHLPLLAMLDSDGTLHSAYSCPLQGMGVDVLRCYSSLTPQDTCSCLRKHDGARSTLWYVLDQVLEACAAMDEPRGPHAGNLLQQLLQWEREERILDAHFTILTRTTAVCQLHDALTRMYRREVALVRSEFATPEIRASIPVLGAEETGTLLVGFQSAHQVEKLMDNIILMLSYAYAVPTPHEGVRVMMVPGRHAGSVKSWLNNTTRFYPIESRMLHADQTLVAEVAVALWNPDGNGPCQHLEGAFEAAERLAEATPL